MPSRIIADTGNSKKRKPTIKAGMPPPPAPKATVVRERTAIVNGKRTGYQSASISNTTSGKKKKEIIKELNKKAPANTALGGKDSKAIDKSASLAYKNGKNPNKDLDNSGIINADRAKQLDAEKANPSLVADKSRVNDKNLKIFKDVQAWIDKGFTTEAARREALKENATLPNTEKRETTAVIDGQVQGYQSASLSNMVDNNYLPDTIQGQYDPNLSAVQGNSIVQDEIKAPTSGTGGTSATGSGTTKTSTTTGTGGSTSTVPEAGTPTASTASDNPYLDTINNMKFEYNPADDKQYLQAASILENQVAQMMVGRGGLYSSVAQSALSSKLIDLQVTYEKLAYDEFKEERSWNLQMASFIENKNATAFNQAMQVAQYKAQREDAAFSKQMQIKQYNLSAANAAFSRQQARLAQQKSDIANQLGISIVEYNAKQATYASMMKKWKTSATASADVMAFFGLKTSVPITSPAAISAVNNMSKTINTDYNYIMNTSKEYGLVSYFQAGMDDFKTTSTVSQADVNKEATLGGTSDQQATYYDVYAGMLNSVNTKSEASAALSKLTNSSNKSQYIASMGTPLYNRLVNEAQTLLSKYSYAAVSD